MAVVYLAGWITAVLLLAITSSGVQRSVLPRWVDVSVTIFIWVALGSVWPMLLLFRAGMFGWHLLGHPGEGRLRKEFAKFTDRAAGAGSCEHQNPDVMQVTETIAWCLRCGALEQKPHAWIRPTGGADVRRAFDPPS